MANKKNVSNQFSAYILNYTLSSSSVGYRIPLLWSPTSISESVSATFDQQAIGGRSAPIITYSNTGARQVSLAFTVTSDYIPASGSFTSLDQYIRALKALVYPSYSGSIVNSPNCLLHLPNLEINGVCSSVNIDYKTDRYTRDGRTAAEISLTFIEVLDTVKGSINIINNSNYVATNEDYEEYTDDYEDYSSATSIHLTLTGEGLSQSSPYTNSNIIRYSTNNDRNNLEVTSIYTDESFAQYLTSQYTKTDDVARVRIDITDKGGNVVAYTENSDWNEIFYGLQRNNDAYVAALENGGMSRYVTFSVMYTPFDSHGQTFTNSVRKRYINVSRV